MFLLFFSLNNDLRNAYGDYHFFWQAVGFVFPISGLIVVSLGCCCCVKEDEFDHDVDAAFNEEEIIESSTAKGNTIGKDVEMAKTD